jgi:hypothetical protein
MDSQGVVKRRDFQESAQKKKRILKVRHRKGGGLQGVGAEEFSALSSYK